MRARGLVAVALAFLASACGGKGDSNGGGGAGGNGDGGAGDCTGAAADLCGPDDQPPPGQGAFAFTVKPLSPMPAGKACPSTGIATEVPVGGGLDADTYLQHVVDGEDGASVTCAVHGDSGGFTVTANLQLGGRALRLDGAIAADRAGEAEVTVTDGQNLTGSLMGASCQLDARQDADNRFQIKPGSLWAGFSCTTVEAAPSSACAASGYLVIENCDQ